MRINILLAGIALTLAACSKAPTETPVKQKSETKPDTNTVHYSVATSPNYPPFQYRDADGRIIGFDVDLLNEIAKKEKFTYKFVAHNDVPLVIDAVKNGKADFGASSIFILDHRKDTINYSNPYMVLPTVFVGLEKADRPKVYEEVKNKKIAVQEGFVAARIFNPEIFEGNTQVSSGSGFLGFKDMLNGKADMVLDSVVSIKHFQENAKGKSLFYLQLPEKHFLKLGYIAKTGNDELTEKLNNGIKAIKADGSYDKVYDKWFGPNSKQPLDIEIATKVFDGNQ